MYMDAYIYTSGILAWLRLVITLSDLQCPPLGMPCPPFAHRVVWGTFFPVVVPRTVTNVLPCKPSVGRRYRF